MINLIQQEDPSKEYTLVDDIAVAGEGSGEISSRITSSSRPRLEVLAWAGGCACPWVLGLFPLCCSTLDGAREALAPSGLPEMLESAISRTSPTGRLRNERARARTSSDEGRAASMLSTAPPLAKKESKLPSPTCLEGAHGGSDLSTEVSGKGLKSKKVL
jgi:hypothetical protein